MQVKLNFGESSDSLLKRFLKKVKKSEMIDELLERKYYKKPSEIRAEEKRNRIRVLEKLKEENRQTND